MKKNKGKPSMLGKVSNTFTNKVLVVIQVIAAMLSSGWVAGKGGGNIRLTIQNCVSLFKARCIIT